MATSGKFLKGEINGGLINGTHEWTVEETGDALEVTTGADNGRGAKEVGVIDTKITVKFYFDTTTGSISFIRPGVSIIDLVLYADANSPALYTISIANVFRIISTAQVRTQWIVTAELEAYGDVVVQDDP